MGEVVDDGDAADFGTDFQPSLDAFEAGKCCLDGLFGNAPVGCQCGCRRGVEGVMFAGQTHLQLGP